MWCTPMTGTKLESTHFSQAAGETLFFPFLVLETKQQHKKQHQNIRGCIMFIFSYGLNVKSEITKAFL